MRFVLHYLNAQIVDSYVHFYSFLYYILVGSLTCYHIFICKNASCSYLFVKPIHFWGGVGYIVFES